MAQTKRSFWLAAGTMVLTGALGTLAASCSSDGGRGTVSGADAGGDGGTVSGTDAGSGDAGGSGDGSSGSSTRLLGTITLPADATGRCAMVSVDTDTTGSNGSARRGDGSYLLKYERVAGKTVEFGFDAVPNGSYFLWAYVDTNSSSSSATGDCEINGAPNSGDFLGYYNTGLAPPNAANVTVPGAASARYDFQVGVFP